MKSYVVIGIGRFGSHVAKVLCELGNDVLAMDEREDRISKIADHVTHAVVGDVKDEDVLKSVGVRNFDCAIVSLSDDIQGSVLVTMLLKEQNVPYIVAKATSDVHVRLLEKIGADKVVFPEKDMGMKLALGLARANILDYIEMSDDFAIAEINVLKRWVGKPLKSLDIRKDLGINIIALKKSDDQPIEIVLDPEYKFDSDDIAVVIGSQENVDKLVNLG